MLKPLRPQRYNNFSKYARKYKKNLRIAGFFSSATRTRTGVYGVRGRCPRPLDDSTRKCLFLKSGAKVLLFFDMTKFFGKKMQLWHIFFFGTLFVR